MNGPYGLRKKFGVVFFLVLGLLAVGVFLWYPITHEREAKADETSMALDPRVIRQLPLVDAGEEIQQLWQSAELEGYTGIRLDDEGNELVLYWKNGQLPSEMTTLVAQLQDNVAIRVVSSPYSIEEFQAEAKRLVELPRTDGVNVNEAGPLRDFSGMKVGVDTDDDRTNMQKLAAARTAITSNFPLELKIASKGTSFRDRWDDESPFYGGAQIDHQTSSVPPSYAYCSTGFAITTSDDTEGMLTAEHCGIYNWEWFTPEGDLSVGNKTNPLSCSHDAATLIGESYSPRIYVGPWEDSEQSKGVTGFAYPMVDQYVFVSGASSGEHIVKVESVNEYVDGECEIYATGPGFWTVDELGDGSAGFGDSGGPVFRYNSPTKVTGIGLIIWGDLEDNEADCEGRQVSGRRCASRVFHTNLGTILSHFDATLQTVD